MLIFLISGPCLGAGGHWAVLCCYVLVVKHNVTCVGCGLLPPLEDAHGALKGVVQAKAMVHLGKEGILHAHDCQVDCRQQGHDLEQRQHRTMLKRGDDVTVGSLLGTCLHCGMASRGEHLSLKP